MKGSYACMSGASVDGIGVLSGADESCLCPAGMFANDTRQTRCFISDFGHYAVDTNGKFSSSGAVSQEEVRVGSYACMNGNIENGFGPDKGADKECPCPAGMYTNSSGQIFCLSASKGYFTVNATGSETSSGAIGQKVSKFGYYTVDANGNAASFRASGQKMVRKGSYACNNGSVINGIGVSSRADGACPCPPGKYTGANAQITCQLCGIGKYFTSFGATNCTACPIGRYADATGSASCSLCEPGKHQARSGASICDPCGLDLAKYAPREGYVDCKILRSGVLRVPETNEVFEMCSR